MSSDDNSGKSTSARENASASSLEDDKLVERAIQGDQYAYKEIMDKYQKPLYFHVLKMVRNHEQVEDLVQEAFMKAFKNLDTYNTHYAFSTWLYRITTNHTIDYLRKKKLKTTSMNEPVKTRDGEIEIQISDEQAKTDRKIIREQRKRIIHEAIENLPEKYRVVIEMRHLQELSYQEIANQLDLPLGTVKAHIFRAREMLYKKLKDKKDRF
ncbi:MAG: sigma-70 family RNA polymerase sigma factor [Bacteroidetes bacterium]|jgi:RNA polymerase sigma-70 factor (ECF subfamily)|nr:sigma-70 family RNA polymerase sigma factor [Bacteroidota bacterium]